MPCHSAYTASYRSQNFPVASAIAMPLRIGGDEFVVFAGMTQKQVESTLLELKHTTEKQSGTKVDRVSISVGYALTEDHKEFSIEELVYH